MKNRIITIVSVAALLCLLVLLAATMLESAATGGTGVLGSGIRWTSHSKNLRHLRDDCMGNARTAVALVRYLLEPEVPELKISLVASNTAKPGLTGGGMTAVRTASLGCAKFPSAFDAGSETQQPEPRSFDGLWSFNFAESFATVLTNSQAASNAPVKNYRPVAADLAGHPA